MRNALMLALFPIVLAIAVGSQADNPTLFVEANSAYDAGNYPHAIALYEELLERGADSGWVYYNLGSSYLRQGNLGRAIAAYRRSEVRLPRDGDVQANLTFARRQAKDALAPVEPLPVVHTLFFWHYGLNFHELVYGTAACNLLLFAALALIRLRPGAEWPRLAAAVFGLGLALGGPSLAIKALAPAEIAVMLGPEVEVHSGTHRDTVVRFKLHEGSEAKIMDSREGWLRIELADGKQGWVAEADVSIVTL